MVGHCLVLNCKLPNVVVEWLTLLLRIREVPALNLGSETDYNHWCLLWFPSVPPGHASTIQFGHERFLPNPLQFIIHLKHYPFIRRYIVLLTEEASLNKLQMNSNETVNSIIETVPSLTVPSATARSRCCVSALCGRSTLLWAWRHRGQFPWQMTRLCGGSNRATAASSNRRK
jgi:hypothetical protein